MSSRSRSGKLLRVQDDRRAWECELSFCSLSFQNPCYLSTNPVNASMVHARQFLTICGLAERWLSRSANPIPTDACTPCAVLCPLAFFVSFQSRPSLPMPNSASPFLSCIFLVSSLKTCFSLIVDVVIRVIAISGLLTNCVSSFSVRPLMMSTDYSMVSDRRGVESFPTS